jgi:hypothetical protein
MRRLLSAGNDANVGETSSGPRSASAGPGPRSTARTAAWICSSEIPRLRKNLQCLTPPTCQQSRSRSARLGLSGCSPRKVCGSDTRRASQSREIPHGCFDPDLRLHIPLRDEVASLALLDLVVLLLEGVRSFEEPHLRVDTFPKGIFRAACEWTEKIVGISIGDRRLKALEARDDAVRPQEHLDAMRQLTCSSRQSRL